MGKYNLGAVTINQVKHIPFQSVYDSPLCTYGLRSLYNFLNAAVDLRIYGNSHGIKYPSVLFSFDVDKDGKLNNVKILKGLDDPYYVKTFSDAVKKLPAWQPGKLYGINTMYTVTITYSDGYINTMYGTSYTKP